MKVFKNYLMNPWQDFIATLWLNMDGIIFIDFLIGE